MILVTTKKGEAGSVYTSVRYEAVASMPTDDIDVWIQKLICECTMRPDDP